MSAEPSRAVVMCRPADAADAPALAAIFLATRQYAFHWLSRETLRLDDFARETAGERITVAEVGRRPVGFISVWEPERFVHHLFVVPEFQRRGVGRYLLNSLGEWLPQPYRLKCALPNGAALRFYTAAGWREVDRGPDGAASYAVLEFGTAATPNQGE